MQRKVLALLQLTTCCLLALVATASAQDKKPDLTGTWKSSSTNQNSGQVRETTFKLKAEGEKVTGTVSGRNNDTAIEEGKIKGNEVSFQVTREFQGNKVVTKYSGKISGDTITGKAESERAGQARSRDWVAQREAAAKETAK